MGDREALKEDSDRRVHWLSLPRPQPPRDPCLDARGLETPSLTLLGPCPSSLQVGASPPFPAIHATAGSPSVASATPVLRTLRRAAPMRARIYSPTATTAGRTPRNARRRHLSKRGGWRSSAAWTAGRRPAGERVTEPLDESELEGIAEHVVRHLGRFFLQRPHARARPNRRRGWAPRKPDRATPPLLRDGPREWSC